MISQAEWQEITNLLNQGLSVYEVSRRTGRCHATINKYLKEDVSGAESENLRVPKLIKPFEKYLKSRIKQNITNRTKLFLEIKDRGYSGSYPTLNNYVTKFLRLPNYKNYRRSIHLETEPGEQAQVDWGSFGKIEIGCKGREEF